MRDVLEKIVALVLSAAIFMILFFGLCVKGAVTYEEPEEIPEYFEVEATAYCDGDICCKGETPRMGICAGKPEWYGNVIALYENDNGIPGDFIGYFECLDTGSESIRSGEVIDIYNPSREWCMNFGRKKVIAIIIEGKG